MIGQAIEKRSRMRAVRMDCFGRGSKVMAPSGPVLLLPFPAVRRPEMVGEIPPEDSLAVSESVSEDDPGESYPCMGLGGMGDGSPQR